MSATTESGPSEAGPSRRRPVAKRESASSTTAPAHARNRPKIENEVEFLSPTSSPLHGLPSRLSLLSPSILDVDPDDAGRNGAGFVPVLSAPAYAPLEAWHTVMDTLIRHPERNSSNILRADVLEDEEVGEEGRHSYQIASAQGSYALQRRIRRRILPRRPGLDWEMEQECRLYHLVATPESQRIEEAVVVYTPLLSQQGRERFPHDLVEQGDLLFPTTEEAIPFYHPKVRAIAFRFFPAPDGVDSDHEDEDGNENEDRTQGPPRRYGTHSISLIPFGSSDPLLPTHRLSRISLHLVGTIHTHTWGLTHAYTKRVHHDQLVPREAYQDLYLALKARYANTLLTTWSERTDPKKHVFEDLGIAAFLILLWRQWWGEDSHGAPGGFVDVGCGNGLLVWILNQEGYTGFGFDGRERKSWKVYNDPDAQRLRVQSFDAPRFVADRLSSHDGTASAETAAGPPPVPCPAASLPSSSTVSFPPDCFLIGNHADELTPWLPLLATSLALTTGCSGYINIPCCPFLLTGHKFSATKYDLADDTIATYLGLDPSGPDRAGPPGLLQTTRDAILRGPAEGDADARGKGTSRNVAYLRYLSLSQLGSGWTVEKEALRIPSTRNWTLVGRRPVWALAEGERAEGQDGAEKVALCERAEEVRRQVRTRCLAWVSEAAGAGWTARSRVEGAAPTSTSH